MKTKTAAFLHYLLFLIALSLPLWLTWKAVLIIVIAYHIIFTHWMGYCPLTLWQFGTTEEGFIEKNLKLIFKPFKFHTKEKNLRLFIRYGIPMLLVVYSYLIQKLIFASSLSKQDILPPPQ